MNIIIINSYKSEFINTFLPGEFIKYVTYYKVGILFILLYTNCIFLKKYIGSQVGTHTITI